VQPEPLESLELQVRQDHQDLPGQAAPRARTVPSAKMGLQVRRVLPGPLDHPVRLDLLALQALQAHQAQLEHLARQEVKDNQVHPEVQDRPDLLDPPDQRDRLDPLDHLEPMATPGHPEVLVQLELLAQPAIPDLQGLQDH